ncbi:MAG: hypothetical protein O7I93_03680 [Gemmatimonadetes bacterium]|nr:hypothetical protein [Gemmatimonadota bacterium]
MRRGCFAAVPGLLVATIPLAAQQPVVQVAMEWDTVATFSIPG